MPPFLGVHICKRRIIIQCTPQGFCQVRWDQVSSVGVEQGLSLFLWMVFPISGRQGSVIREHQEEKKKKATKCPFTTPSNVALMASFSIHRTLSLIFGFQEAATHRWSDLVKKQASTWTLLWLHLKPISWWKGSSDQKVWAKYWKRDYDERCLLKGQGHESRIDPTNRVKIESNW